MGIGVALGNAGPDWFEAVCDTTEQAKHEYADYRARRKK
jgi:hypothetical protein